MEEKQLEMDLEKYRYSAEKMGITIAHHTIFLFDSLIQKKLRPCSLEIFPTLSEKEKITNIGCPFCEKGFLKLSKIEPKYSGGLGRVSSTQYHVGNNYEWVCSNPECDGKFLGDHTWMYID